MEQLTTTSTEIISYNGDIGNDDAAEEDGDGGVVTLEETTANVVEEVGPHTIEENWQCGECVTTRDSMDELLRHMEVDHKEFQEVDRSDTAHRSDEINTDPVVNLEKILEIKDKELTKAEKELET